MKLLTVLTPADEELGGIWHRRVSTDDIQYTLKIHIQFISTQNCTLPDTEEAKLTQDNW